MLDFVKRHSFTLFTVLAVAMAIFLRVFNLMQVPPSLYWEEAALGYDAYSIAQTGKDHHGNAWPLVAFESFGDWKPSLYFYSIVPFVKVFGLVPWAIRAPAVLSGIAIVIAVGWLSYLVGKRLDVEHARHYGMAGLLVAAYSPWAIQFSRAGWEVNLATALVSWGMVVGLQVVTQTKAGKKMITSFSLSKALGAVFLLVLAVYAYHGTRLIAPLLGVLLALDWWWQLKSTFSFKQIAGKVIIPGLVAMVMMAPILVSLRSPQVTQRFAETSIFSQLDVIVESNEAKAAAGNSAISSLLYHRYLLFGREILINYFDHFNLTYLVVSGDTNLRHSTGYGGLLYYQDVLFLAIGLLCLVTSRKTIGWLVLGWWLVSIVPAALTTATPHALRTLPGMPAVLTLVAIGLYTTYIWVKKWLTETFSAALYLKSIFGLFLLLVGAVYAATWTQWAQYYYFVYPVQASSEWQYGYQQMVEAVNQLKEQHPELPIYITREQGRPAMYYWFFSQTEPHRVQAANASAAKDQGEYLTFENITFPNTVSEVKSSPAIVASSPEGKEQLVTDGYTITNEVIIKTLLGKPTWSVYQVSK